MKIVAQGEQQGSAWAMAPAVPFGERLLPSILEDGYVRVDMNSHLARQALGASGTDILHALYEESDKLFRRPDFADFRRPDNYAGARMPNVAKLDTEDKADGNLSFLDYPMFDMHGRIREDGERKIPHADRIRSFRRALGNFTLMSAEVTERIFDELAEEYSYPDAIEFRDASVSQVNWYHSSPESLNPVEPRGEYIQPLHNDANDLTVIAANKPGLRGYDPRKINVWPSHYEDLKHVQSEAADYEHLVPISLKDGEVLVMTGSLMSARTGGRIRPFYHAPFLESPDNDGRVAAMYFVSGSVKWETQPYVRNWFNEGVSLQDETILLPSTFNLGPDFVPGSLDVIRRKPELRARLARMGISLPDYA